ncbi:MULTISPECIES: hypothetical protein [Pseudomonas]|uniref:Uncharacterized protein n=2 Tax=Pseudomonas TaxID=286 RepID=A0ABU6BZA3_9PSED|nr:MULTISPECIES: hypothetical protein [Pseudomonas]KWV68883.1 hypothetical protein PFLuk1_03563 [Pseudomonas fluorescens]MBW9242376.1 hypothetical protein [Pseudomonas paracarnis]MEB3785127.1 hypothetical protein [Pseudomonas paracarnis]OJT29075.1 hypothetical protein BOP96_17720 [Pseudomonas sp. FSL W5-0203]
MLLRTLEIPDAHGQLLNAVVLCGFTATSLNQQFLVYSLNEKSGDELVKIYLTNIEGEGQKLHMCDVPAEILTTAVQVLRHIFRDACAPDPIQTDDTYALMDLTDTDIQCSAVSTHYNLKISDAWLTSLLRYEPQKKASSFSLQSDTNVGSTAIAAPATDELLVTPAEQTTSERIEANLKSLIASITHHKQILLSQYVLLDERQRQLDQFDQTLKHREAALKLSEQEALTNTQLIQEAEKMLNEIMKAEITP